MGRVLVRGGWAVAIAMVVASVCSGCASTVTTPVRASDAVVRVPVGRYDEAFAAAREELLAWRFPLERVDLEQGVISTGEKRTSGLLSPWDPEQTGATMADDFANHHVRRARVRFTPSRAEARAQGEGASPEAGTEVGTLRCDVEVFVYRLHTPDLRVPERAVGLSTQAFDPVAARRGVAGRYEAPLSRDDATAARIAATIRARMAGGG